jgi:hypothetical protein
VAAPGPLTIAAPAGALGPFMDRCDVGAAATRADLDRELTRIALHSPNHTEQARVASRPMTDVQGWFLVVEVGVLALAALVGLLRR